MSSCVFSHLDPPGVHTVTGVLPLILYSTQVVDDPEEDNLYMVFELLERGEVLEIPAVSPLKEEEAW